MRVSPSRRRLTRSTARASKTPSRSWRQDRTSISGQEKPILIRTCTRGDCDAVTALNRELGYAGTSAEMLARLDAVLDAPGQTVFVAEVDGTVAGWIHMAVIPSIETAPFAEIRGLIVGEAARRHGVGAALVAAGETWAREQGMSRIRVRSNVTRETARRFYETIGYRVTKTQNVFDRDLSP